MAGTSWPALVAGARARAADVELKLDWIEGNFVPMSGGSTTDGAYDLGTSAARWRDLHLSRRINIGSPTGSTGFFHGRPQSNMNLVFDTNTSFTSTAVGIKAINDSGSTIPLEIRASKTRITTGDFALADTSTAVSEFSTDGTLAGNSDIAVPTEKAVKTYVDAQIGISFLVSLANSTITSGTISSMTFGAAVVNVGSGWTTTGCFVAPANGVYEFEFVMTEANVGTMVTGTAIEIGIQYASSEGSLYLPSTTSDILVASRAFQKMLVTHANQQTFRCTGVFAMSIGSAARPVVNTGAGAATDTGAILPVTSSKSFFAGKLWGPL